MNYILLLAALAFVLSPVVSGSFGGFEPYAFPHPQKDPPVQPAGWAFAIWGVIYLWLLVHAIVGATIRRRDSAWAPMRPALTVSLGVGAFWIPVANASPLWATVMIWIMAAFAIAAYMRAPMADRLLAVSPVGLYAGWLVAAGSVSLALVASGYLGMDEEPAAIGAVLLATLIGIGSARLRHSVSVSAAIAWAFLGIAAANAGDSWLVCGLALAGAVVIGLRTYLPPRA